MDLIAIDVETEPFNSEVARVRDRYQTPRLVCIQVASADSAEILYPGPELKSKITTFLSGQIVGHNFAFDLNVLLGEYPELDSLARDAVLSGRILDTMVLAHLREPDVSNKQLGRLAERYLDMRLAKDDAIQSSFRRGVPLTLAQEKYALEDAIATRRLAQELLALPLGSVYEGPDHPRHEIECGEIHDLPLSLDQLYSACAIASGVWVECRGWTIDVDRLTVLRDEARRDAKEALQRLRKAGLAEPARDTNAPAVEIEWTRAPKKWTYMPAEDRWERTQQGEAQAQANRWKLAMGRLRAEFAASAEPLKIELPRTPTGAVQTRYAFWKPYRPLLSEPLQAYLDYSKAQKLESAFFSSWLTSRSGKLYPQFWIPGTATLRHSCSKPNLQQVPKKLRPILYRPGKQIVGADYTALECYTLAHHMACLGLRGPLLETLTSGKDIHSYTAAMLAGGTAEDHGKGTTTRQSAKACNFGVPGGLGAEKFWLLGKTSYGLEWTIEEAVELREQYLATFWDIDSYLELLREKRPSHLRPDDMTVPEWLEELGFDEWPGNFELAKAIDEGRIYDVQLSTGMRVPARNFTQAANLPFQHLGAVIITLATLNAISRGLVVAGAVHDALYVESESGQVDAAGRQLEESMQEAFQKVCPLVPVSPVEAEYKETFF